MPFIGSNVARRLRAGMILLVVALIGPASGGPESVADVAKPKRVVYLLATDDNRISHGYNGFLALCDAVRRRLGKDGQGVAFEFVSAVGEGDGPAIAAAERIVSERPDVIVATSNVALEAVKRWTRTIPVLFLTHADPVALGHVKSIVAPGANLTGFTYFIPIEAKDIETLVDAFPSVRHVGVIADDYLLHERTFLDQLQLAREKLSVTVQAFPASDIGQLRAVLRREARSFDGWLVPVSGIMTPGFDDVVREMQTTGRPVIYTRRLPASLGGSLSYEAIVAQATEIWARQIALILGGVDPATIPVEQPDAFDLAINIGTAQQDTALRPSKAILLRANRFYMSGASTAPASDAPARASR